MHLLLFFSKLSLRSRVVNWLAISAFGAYLTQSSSFIGSRFYDQIILGWFNHEPRLRFIILTGLLIVSVFLGSILIDKVRLVLWKLVQRIVHNVLTTNRN